MAIHPKVVELLYISLDQSGWVTGGQSQPSQANLAKIISKIKAKQIFLNDPFYHWWAHVPAPPPLCGHLWSFINSESWDNQVHLFPSIRWAGFPSENSSPPKGCLYLPSILAALCYSLPACLHSWCQVLTDASSCPLSNASHFSVFLSFFVVLLSAQSGLSLKEACLCFSQTHGYLMALLFSFLPSLFSLNTLGKFGFVSDIFALSCWPVYFSSSVCSF